MAGPDPRHARDRTDLKAGRFRIARAGSTVHYLVAAKDSDAFREVAQNEFGTGDLSNVRLMALVNGSGAALDVLWTDLTIRAEALPGFTDGRPPEPQRTSWWLLLAGLSGVTALGIGVWWLGARRGGGSSRDDEGPRTMKETTRERQLRWDWGLAGAAAVALAIRLVHLTDRSFWYDESSSWQTAKFDFPDMIRSVRLNVHLPLYYTLLKGWMAAWGESVASLRGFSVFFGVLTVVLSGVFAGELYRVSSAGDGDEADRRRFARIVALLVAVSPFQAFYSAEARMYSLGTTFTALGAWLLLRALREPSEGRPWWAFGAACDGLLYTHHYGLFTVAAWYLFLGLYASWLLATRSKTEAATVFAGL